MGHLPFSDLDIYQAGEERDLTVKTRSKSAVKNVPTGCDTLMVKLSPSLVLLMG